MPNSIYDERIVFLPIASFVPYAEYPFKLYDGERFDDMVKSIKEMGIIVPIIVRPIGEDNKKYEILSGHNRIKAAKSAELSEIPAIIKIGLNDNEAKLIVTETNLLQRSFADLSYSERAVVLKTHMDAVKKQGKRNELINEVNYFINLYGSDSGSASECCEDNKKAGYNYNLSPRTIARYIRITELIKPLQVMADNGQIGLCSAALLSYLLPDEQKKVSLVLFEKDYKISIKKANILRESSKNQELSNEQIIEILSER